MAESTICQLCSQPGELATSGEIARIASNVRKFAAETFTVWRCDHCRSLHSKEDVDLDHYYAHYPLAQSKLSYLNKLAFLSRLKLIRRAGIRPEHRLLDYGCGVGHFLTLLRERGYTHATGYDPYIPQFADRAALPAPFDAIVSYGVIEHVPDPAAYLRELRELLRPGGMAVVATPDANGLQLQQPDALMLHQPYHRHILSEQAMRELAPRHGFNSRTSREGTGWIGCTPP